MLLGMWTTAATFYGLMFVDFPSLQQLGALIGHSMVICGILTLVLVPALLPRARRGARGASAHDAAARRLGRAASNAHPGRRRGRHRGARARRPMQVRINPTLDRLRSVTPGAVALEPHRLAASGCRRMSTSCCSAGPDLDGLLRRERTAARPALRGALPRLAVHAASALLPSRPRRPTAPRSSRRPGSRPPTVAAELEPRPQSEGFSA